MQISRPTNTERPRDGCLLENTVYLVFVTTDSWIWKIWPDSTKEKTGIPILRNAGAVFSKKENESNYLLLPFGHRDRNGCGSTVNRAVVNDKAYNECPRLVGLKRRICRG